METPFERLDVTPPGQGLETLGLDILALPEVLSGLSYRSSLGNGKEGHDVVELHSILGLVQAVGRASRVAGKSGDLVELHSSLGPVYSVGPASYLAKKDHELVDLLRSSVPLQRVGIVSHFAKSSHDNLVERLCPDHSLPQAM